MKLKSIEDNRNYNVDVTQFDSVHTLKKNLCSATKLNLDEIILIHKNRVLKNDKLIRDYNIGVKDFVLFGHEGMNESYYDNWNNRDKKNYLGKFCINCYEKLIEIVEPTQLNDDGEKIDIAVYVPHLGFHHVFVNRNEKIRNVLFNRRICTYNSDLCKHCNGFELCFNGDNLKVDETFADYKIEDGDWMTLSKGVSGGGKGIQMTIKCINGPFDPFEISSTAKIIRSNIINQISNTIRIPNDNIRLFLDRNQSIKLKSYVELNQEPIDIYLFIKPNFDNLVKLEKLGKGSFGTVFKCVSIETKKEIALKKLKIPLTNETNENILSFERELQVYSKHSCHPRIVKYERNFQTENAIFLVMEYMKGGSLRSYLKKNGPLSENKIQKYAKQVLEGLQYLHEQQILHRDIKSDNILLDEDDNVKLCDFGLSKDLADFATNDFLNGVTQSTVGTVNYMAPEIMNGEPYGPSADIWSFGATMVEMLTGFPPYYKVNACQVMMIISKSRKIEYNYSNDLSGNLKSFIDSCLQSKPTKRLTTEQLMNHSFLWIYEPNVFLQL